MVGIKGMEGILTRYTISTLSQICKLEAVLLGMACIQVC